MKLTKPLDLLAHPKGFEPLTLGLEMQGIGHTNDIVLHRFTSFCLFTIVILQRVYENGLKTHSSNLRNLRMT